MQDAAIWAMVTPLLPKAEWEVDRFMARRPTGVERADLVQVAALALFHAARRYDAANGGTLWSFARFRVVGALRDAQYRSRGWRRHWGRFRPARGERTRRWGDHGTQECSSERWHVLQESVRREWRRTREENIAPSPEDSALRQDVLHSLEDCMAELEPEERRLLVEVYGNERTLQDVAEELGCHRSSVSRQHTALLDYLRMRLSQRRVRSTRAGAAAAEGSLDHCRARRRRWSVVTRKGSSGRVRGAAGLGSRR